jgi:hypothetical protein
MAAMLGAAHVEAIRRLAAAALEASERGDRRETARLACAAARLCGEIRGHWPPSAVNTPGRSGGPAPVARAGDWEPP